MVNLKKTGVTLSEVCVVVVVILMLGAAVLTVIDKEAFSKEGKLSNKEYIVVAKHLFYGRDPYENSGLKPVLVVYYPKENKYDDYKVSIDVYMKTQIATQTIHAEVQP